MAVKLNASINELCQKYISITGSYINKVTKAGVNTVKGMRPFLCFNCRKPGHKIAECPGWKEVKPKTSGVVLIMPAYAMIPAAPSVETNVMLFVTGASHHVVSDSKWLHDAGESDVRDVQLGGGERHIVASEGSIMLDNGGPSKMSNKWLDKLSLLKCTTDKRRMCSDFTRLRISINQRLLIWPAQITGSSA
jgi:hypothetical protein